MQTQHIIQYFSHLGLWICIVFAYFFMRGLLGIFYDIASWAVVKLDGPDNEGDPNPPR